MAHQFGVRGLGGRIHPAAVQMVGKGGLGPPRADEAADQGAQLLERRLALPQPHRAALQRAAFGEQGGLGALQPRLPRRQRDADDAADIDQHGPEQAVGDGIKPFQPQEGIGFQQPLAEQPVGDEGLRQPSRLRERRQQQRIKPDQETACYADDGAAGIGARPEQPQQDGRKELRHRGKRHQPIATSA